jgi:thioredoxin 1
MVAEFGSPFCGYCAAHRLRVRFRRTSGVRHVKIPDATGAAWTQFRRQALAQLVFLSNGQETARLVRPSDAKAIADELAKIDIAE